MQPPTTSMAEHVRGNPEDPLLAVYRARSRGPKTRRWAAVRWRGIYEFYRQS